MESKIEFFPFISKKNKGEDFYCIGVGVFTVRCGVVLDHS